MKIGLVSVAQVRYYKQCDKSWQALKVDADERNQVKRCTVKSFKKGCKVGEDRVSERCLTVLLGLMSF